MRLICPNCDAQYEVPDDVMPAAGRDVQCSNCGKTWFQHHPDHTPDEDISVDDLPASDEETAPPPPPPAAPAAPAHPERKQLDPAVADILRQEAEAERAARRAAQSGGLESQPDLGMGLEDFQPEDDVDRRAREAQERMAKLRGNDTPEVQVAGGGTATTAAALGSRRDLLPDIEEINSTLRSGTSRTGAGSADVDPIIEAPTHQRKRRGFRTGFLTVLLIFVVLLVIYILAPRLSAAVPALEGPLQSYVNAVDQGRVWLDDKVKSMLQSLDSAAADSNN
ncbi:zinc-ribbon domain-containing protein [Sulfitobacter sp. F26169L]|uniref:zinc-ribbon domain-containing protein n=1 Tax=Sulfitobacter sp. F26169L TaxID=2996015 RepID=UPI002260E6A6|nr:zinc-ribbon domain-containing protein [Sulfitobacter sp. F26169L]MCX7567249.1 zinc-ribbon domain-containing protein [Sulfitobacter sp. F26169L]